MSEAPEHRLARKLATVPDGCRELDAAIERCKARRRGDRFKVAVEVDDQGEVVALEVPRRFERGARGAA